MMQCSPAPFDLAEVLHSAAVVCRPMLLPGVTLRCEVPSKAELEAAGLATVNSDAGMILQVREGFV